MVRTDGQLRLSSLGSDLNPGNNLRILQLACGSGVGLFFGLMFAVPSGYSYGAAVLFLTALVCACTPAGRNLRQSTCFSREDSVLAWVLFAYFLVALASTTWLGNDFRDLDQPLRAALAVPVLWLLSRVPYDSRWLWGGIIMGVTLSVGVAWWQLYYLGLERAEGHLNIIHFGNIALVFGAFCAAGVQWAIHLPAVQRHAWWLAFAVGMGGSGYSMVASGSRGSWVALPTVIALYAIAFLNRRNLAMVTGVILAVAVAGAIMFQQPDSRLRIRYEAAVQDIQLFQQGDADTSLGARFVMWHGALLNIPERLWQGWNMQDYKHRLEERIAEGEVDSLALRFSDNLHNSYFQALAFQGVAGLLALLAVYLVPFWGFCRRLRDRDLAIRAFAYCGAALCSSYMLFSLTQVILRRNNGIMFYVVALVIIWSAMRMHERRRR